MPNIKLEVQHISVEYQMKRITQRIEALNGVSFIVKSGQFVTIVGPSGCGKTTLLHAIAGLRNLKSGKILLDGNQVTGPSNEVAMVFQSPSLLPWRTVNRNIAYGLELQGISRHNIATRIKPMIDLVQLSGFEFSYPRELSGGMQQRANLARALVTDPELLLLDEPLASLDAQTRETMQLELQNIWLSTGKTALLVTHQIDEAIFLGDIVIVMTPRPGRIREIILVEFPRPRPYTIKSSPAFMKLQQHIWGLIQPAVIGTEKSLSV